jgi:hypothetical protein
MRSPAASTRRSPSSTANLTEAKERRDPLDTIRFSVVLANTGIYLVATAPLRGFSARSWTSRRRTSPIRPLAPASAWRRRACTRHRTSPSWPALRPKGASNPRAERAQPLYRQQHARAEVGLGHREEAASRALASLPCLSDTSPTNAGRGYALAAVIFNDLGDPEAAVHASEIPLVEDPSVAWLAWPRGRSLSAPPAPISCRCSTSRRSVQPNHNSPRGTSSIKDRLRSTLSDSIRSRRATPECSLPHLAGQPMSCNILFHESSATVAGGRAWSARTGRVCAPASWNCSR